MLRVITEIKPTWIIGENVAGIINMALDTVLADLELQGYEARTIVLNLCGVVGPFALAHRPKTGGFRRKVQAADPREQ